MKEKPIASVTKETLSQLLSSIPFYKAVRKESESQFDILMNYSRIMQFQSGETILSAGDMDTWTYFLVKGQLVVSIWGEAGPRKVNYITPGEVFGDLSVLLQGPRTADVKVDENCKEAILFGTDFGLFGDLVDFSQITLPTKLHYYRHLINSLRWKLEMYRAKYRNHPMANKHREIMPYRGIKDSELELKSLYQEAVEMAKLFIKWNQSFGNISVADGQIPLGDLQDF